MIGAQTAAVNLELWQLITLLLGFFGAVWAFGNTLFREVDKRLDARFAAMEASRRESQQQWGERFDNLQRASNDEREGMRRVEHDLLRLRAELPEKYVLREDWLRTQSIVELKIDKLAMRIENILMGNNNDR